MEGRVIKIHHPPACPGPALCGCPGIYDFDSCEGAESSTAVGMRTFSFSYGLKTPQPIYFKAWTNSFLLHKGSEAMLICLVGGHTSAPVDNSEILDGPIWGNGVAACLVINLHPI